MSTLPELNVSLPRLPMGGEAFLGALAEHCDLYVPLEHRDYSQIEREIDECDALLALVDENWMCSTWKASEVTWASAGSGARRVDAAHRHLPVFIAHLDDCKLGFLEGMPGLVLLPADPAAAVRMIVAALVEARTR